ncbi:MAG: DUF362 domain-containing protein [Candidatus Poribacteria bacterium]
MSEKVSRRKFIKGAAMAGLAVSALPLVTFNEVNARKGEYIAERPIQGVDNDKQVKLIVAQGDDPKKLTVEAITAFGGIGQFVKRGDVVMIKPNIGWNRKPEQAANTNPIIVGALVELCKNAGAKKVKVFDNSVNKPRIAYKRSGIEKAVKQAGGSIIYPNRRKFKEVAFPEGDLLKKWPVYKDVLDADVLINVPIAKHHNLTRLTLAMKNLMGVLGGVRGDIHRQIDEKLADISTKIKPHLIIMDAYRILTANGPNGGTPEDIKLTKQLIVGTDPVAIDSYSATLFGLTGEDLGYVRIGHERGLGEIDLQKVNIQLIEVA